jgi:hypothetical protein
VGSGSALLEGSLCGFKRRVRRFKPGNFSHKGKFRYGFATLMRAQVLDLPDDPLRRNWVSDLSRSKTASFLMGEADRQVADLPRISVAKPYRTQLNESFEIRAIFARNLSRFPQFIYIEEQ